MEKLGHLLLNQGLEVIRALRREPPHHHAPLLRSFLPQMHNQNLTKREMSTSSENPRPGRGGEGVEGEATPILQNGWLNAFKINVTNDKRAEERFQMEESRRKRP